VVVGDVFVGPEVIIGVFDGKLPPDGMATKEFDPVGLICGKLLLCGKDFESFTFTILELSVLGFMIVE
jgi:hypothetical protein